MAERAGRFGAALLLSLYVASACTLRKDPPPGASGVDIYALQNCANCHGQLGRGNALGPPLSSLARHWTRELLVEYLADPRPFVERDERLTALDAEYSGQMSRYDNLSVEQRRVLAEWLLEL